MIIFYLNKILYTNINIMNCLSKKNSQIVIEIPKKNNNSNNTLNVIDNNLILNKTYKQKLCELLTYNNAKNITLFCSIWFLIWSFLVMLSLMGNAFKLGSELVSAVVVGTIIGFILDSWFDTKPWLIIIFFFLGAAAGMLNVIKTANRMQKED